MSILELAGFLKILASVSLFVVLAFACFQISYRVSLTASRNKAANIQLTSHFIQDISSKRYLLQIR
jgi:hypothetical protein